MALRTIYIAIVLAALASGGAVRAAPPLPPAVGLSEAAAQERAALFTALATAADEASGHAIERKIWAFWLGLADDESRALFERSRQAQLRADYDEALVFMKALVVHAPDYSEGWNQLGYVLFLAGKYDASLVAIEQALKLEPLHYAALAGKAQVLMAQGKDAQAQEPLRQAVAIDPWLRERALLAPEPGRKI